MFDHFMKYLGSDVVIQQKAVLIIQIIKDDKRRIRFDVHLLRDVLVRFVAAFYER